MNNRQTKKESKRLSRKEKKRAVKLYNRFDTSTQYSTITRGMVEKSLSKENRIFGILCGRVKSA